MERIAALFPLGPRPLDEALFPNEVKRNEGECAEGFGRLTLIINQSLFNRLEFSVEFNFPQI